MFKSILSEDKKSISLSLIKFSKSISISFPSIFISPKSDVKLKLSLNISFISLWLLFINSNQGIKLTIKINNKDKTVLFSDNGSGIPKEIQDKIFNTFFTTKESGTGLGLSLSNRILKNNNAKLELNHSVANVDTCFSIDFSGNS